MTCEYYSLIPFYLFEKYVSRALTIWNRYTAATPNGQKISITLEELGVHYNVHKIEMSKNQQKEDWFLEINRKSNRPSNHPPWGSMLGKAYRLHCFHVPIIDTL